MDKERTLKVFDTLTQRIKNDEIVITSFKCQSITERKTSIELTIEETIYSTNNTMDQICATKTAETEITPEQQARDLLERMGIDNAQQMTAGDVGEIANLFAQISDLKNNKSVPQKITDPHE